MLAEVESGKVYNNYYILQKYLIFFFEVILASAAYPDLTTHSAALHFYLFSITFRLLVPVYHSVAQT